LKRLSLIKKTNSGASKRN